MKTGASTFFAVLVCFTGIQRVIGEPVSVAPHGNDSGAAVDSLAAFNPAEDTTAADTEYAPRTSTPLFLPEDSLFKNEKEAGHVDSTRVSAQTDTSGTVAATDTFGRRPDSGALELSETMHLYPGISVEQHVLARLMLDYFYNADWDSSDIAAKNLQKLEKEQQLPPLSALLMVGVRVLRVLHGEYENDRVKKALRRDIDKISARGLERADPKKNPDSCRATNLLITGGIKGFVAALEIDRNPINAALSGLSSLKLLKKAIELDTTVNDAWLGLALFNCVMSKAPAIVRGALAIIGRKVSLAKGVSYLRICAYRGCYTNETAKLCLTEFLSPFLGNEAREKRMVIRSLERQCPHNPFFTFLELEEILCFQPAGLFGFSFKERMQQQIGQFVVSDYSSKCYANLVKWQYLLIDPFPSEELAPDKTFKLRGFSYYPVFLQALREKILHGGDSTETKIDRAHRLRFIAAMGARAERMLDASDQMPSNQKGLYLWHVRDALKIDNEQKK
jgi:hypothetical protein